MFAILTFFVGHWALCVFVQTFYLHRYGAHGQFTMSKGWERFFHLLTYFAQGSSFLHPRAYAVMHREHHAFADTERDPHSPMFFKDVMRMMWATKVHYDGIVRGTKDVEARFQHAAPEWPIVDALASSWTSRILWGAAYTVFYIAFAPHWLFFVLVPVHYLMGPVHGAIVNWAGHKYGYRNFDTSDDSKNTLPVELLIGGELFQNNHHKYPMAPNFAARWFEVDPTYQVIRVLAWMKVVDLGAKPQKARYGAKAPVKLPAMPTIPAMPAMPATLRERESIAPA